MNSKYSEWNRRYEISFIEYSKEKGHFIITCNHSTDTDAFHQVFIDCVCVIIIDFLIVSLALNNIEYKSHKSEMKKKDNKMQTTFFNNKLHLGEDFSAVVGMHFFFQ